MTPTTPDVRLQRLEEAKERALKMRSEAQKDQSQALPRTFQGPYNTPSKDFDLPVPLPVEITASNNNAVIPADLLRKLYNKDDGFIGPLPLPVKFEQDIARESTQNKVVETLEHVDSSINLGIRDLTKKLVDAYSAGTEQVDMSRFDDIGPEKNIGWFTKMFDSWRDKISFGLQGIIGEEAYTQLSGAFAPVVALERKQTEYLQEMNKTNNTWIGLQKLWRAEDKRLNLRDSLGSDKERPESRFRDAFAGFGPQSGVSGIAWKMLSNTIAWFADTGDMIAKSTNDTAKKLLLSNSILLAAPKALGVLTFFAGATTFIASMAALTLASPIYAAFRDPEQMKGYLEVFGKIWSDNILPTLEWMATQFVPDMAVVFAALMVVADQVLLAVGTEMNEAIIPGLEALSDIAVTAGRMFRRIYDFSRDQLTETEEGIQDDVNDVFTLVNNLMDDVLTLAARSIRYKGEKILADDQTLFQKFDEEWANLMNIVGGWWDSFEGGWNALIEMTHGWKDDLINSVTGFIQGIVSIIPTWEDIRAWMRGSIINMFGPDIGGSLADTLGLTARIERDDTGVSQSLSIDDIARELSGNITPSNDNITPPAYLHRDNINTPIRQSTPNIIIQAPVTNNNQSSQVIGQSQGRLGLPGTQPRQSVWDQGIYNFGY